MENQGLGVGIKSFRVGKGMSLDLWVSNNEEDFFSPNDVSGLLVTGVEIEPNDVVFEIGAGICPISILLAEKQPEIKQIYCVEIVPEQVTLARKNILKYNLENKIKPLLGNLFEPIKENFTTIKANVIIDDCSGLSPVAKELGWYPDGDKIPLGGIDGTEKVIPFLEKAGSYLAEGGTVYFPTTPNFSDEEKIINVARKHFSRVEVLLEKKLPLTQHHREVISKTKSIHLFEPIVEMGSRGFWTAKIWRVKGPLK